VKKPVSKFAFQMQPAALHGGQHVMNWRNVMLDGKTTEDSASGPEEWGSARVVPRVGSLRLVGGCTR
jgi:hypothetical protein